LLLHPGSFARMFGGFVMANDTAYAGADQAVMTDKMPGDAADCSSFQASCSISRGAGQSSHQQGYRNDYCSFHFGFSAIVICRLFGNIPPL
jgi:hypothetical protein